MDELFIYVDGGARGNPGPAAIGVSIQDKDKKQIASIGKKIGKATNNIAEYSAVIEALSWLVENKKTTDNYNRINFFLDSLLVKSQITGHFKVKNSELREKLFIVRQKESQIKPSLMYKFVPREKNKAADALVNRALDNIL